MAGLVQSILEDRERYRMIKYVVVTPASLFPFLLGRSLARVLISFVAVALTLLVGVVFLGVELRPNLLILVPATVIGVLGVMALGIFMAGWCLQLRQEAWYVPRGDRRRALPGLGRRSSRSTCCPPFVQPIAYAMPTTWWLEASRRGLLGHGSPGALGGISDGAVMLLLVVTTAVRCPGARVVRVVHAPRPPGGAARHGDRELTRLEDFALDLQANS